MPDPTPAPDAIDEIEKLIDEVLVHDPAKAERLHGFLLKVKALQPFLAALVKMLAAAK